MNPYESERSLNEYLLFHYGTISDINPPLLPPSGSLNFAVRAVSECLDTSRLPTFARALDLGCAVGRSSFELARHCHSVIGIDFSERFIQSARHLKESRSHPFYRIDEGELSTECTARLPTEIETRRVEFETGDAMNIRSNLGVFDVVLMANLIDRLSDPSKCLAQLPGLIKPGGQLIIISPYTWLEDFTPKENWLGGFVSDGRHITTLETLRKKLSPDFEETGIKDLPFLIREHARKFQWSISQASMWTRR